MNKLEQEIFDAIEDYDDSNFHESDWTSVSKLAATIAIKIAEKAYRTGVYHGIADQRGSFKDMSFEDFKKEIL